MEKIYKLAEKSNRQSGKLSHTMFSALALVVVGAFAFWWFNVVHIADNFSGTAKIIDWLLFITVSYVIWHPIVMEVIGWGISSNIKDIREQKPLSGLRVAFITTIVPKNEPIELLHKCLPAMVNAKYTHDTWLLDEGNNEEIKKICDTYGVKYFTRFGKDEYNTHSGKFTRTKGGNHNSWYEVYGDDYDFVAQVDTDFVPNSDFLTKTLGYFRDPKVAFVGTPQIYGNTSDSFVALGASQQQLSFYGAILRGLSGMGMTLLIGANHILRVSAFRSVNHYTAHITEDLVTGMKLHADGWKSVYVPMALAIGEGPSTWESYFNQQLRWAYGCIDILFHHSFRHFRKMRLRQVIYYFFLQQHYFSGLAMALGTLFISLYFLFGIRAADVDITKFFIGYTGVLITCWLMSVWMQLYDVNRKSEGKLFLAGKIISIAVWPIWFLASVRSITGQRMSYKVTPKGQDASRKSVSLRPFIPHFIFAAISVAGLISSYFTHRQSPLMIFWALSSAIFMTCIPFIDIFIHQIRRISLKVFTVAKKLFFRSGMGDVKSEESAGNNFVHDIVFLSVVVLTSIAGYVGKLGFYGDDWSFLGNFVLSDNQSLFKITQNATTPNTYMRPLQNLYDASLYWLFGLQPLGYHLVNTVVFVLVIVVFYLILRLVKMPRVVALTAPLVYSLLPNYSTNRFWYAAFQVNLSMLLFLLSTYFGIKALLPEAKKPILYKALSLVCLILAALGYEVILPLVLLNVLIFWNPVEKFAFSKSDKKLNNHGVFIALNFIVLAYLLIFKAKTTTRLGILNYPGDIILLGISVVRTNFIELGLKIPLVLNKIILNYYDPFVLILGSGLCLFIFCYVFIALATPSIKLPSRSFMLRLILLNTLIFFLGYGIFFVNNRVGFSPTGIDNRVSIASSIGIAFMIVGVVGWFSKMFSELFSKWLFSMTIAIVCTVGFFIINTLAIFWTSAYSQAEVVLTGIHNQFPTFPKNSTLILDGVCPYVGPAIVFESHWDLKGALQVTYKDETIQADVVTPRLKVMEDGIKTQIYTFESFYPYKNLFIYNFKNKEVFNIADQKAADEYFQKYNPDHNNNCPPAEAGNGVSVF